MSHPPFSRRVLVLFAPRTGLKPGLRDAGVAARGMELVATRPRPDGFHDPKNPAGEAMPSERQAGAPAPAAPRPLAGPGALDFANSDIAFSGQRMVIGNFHGFNACNIESVKSPRLLASVVCPGGQGDVSIYGNLLFMSVEHAGAGNPMPPRYVRTYGIRRA